MSTVNIRWLSGPIPSHGWSEPILRHIVNLNLVLLPIAFVLNIIHCKILRLSLQHDGFYTFQMFLCVSHFSYCLVSWIPTLLHFLRPDEEYCDRGYSYSDITVQLISGTVRETSLTFSSWLVLVMSIFSGLGTQWKTFKNPKITFWMSILILKLAAFCAIVVWTKLKIYTVSIDLACEIAFKNVHDKFMAALPSETMTSYNLTLQAVNNLKIATTIYVYPSIVVFLIVVIISLLLRKSLEDRSTHLSVCAVNLLQTCLFSVTKAIELLMLTTNYNDSLRYAQWFSVILAVNIILQPFEFLLCCPTYRSMLWNWKTGNVVETSAPTLQE